MSTQVSRISHATAKQFVLVTVRDTKGKLWALTLAASKLPVCFNPIESSAEGFDSVTRYGVTVRQARVIYNRIQRYAFVCTGVDGTKWWEGNPSLPLNIRIKEGSLRFYGGKVRVWPWAVADRKVYFKEGKSAKNV